MSFAAFSPRGLHELDFGEQRVLKRRPKRHERIDDQQGHLAWQRCDVFDDRAILDADPSIWEDVASIPNHDRGRQRINDAIATSIKGWHATVYNSWRIGMLGELAHQFSHDLDIRVPD